MTETVNIENKKLITRRGNIKREITRFQSFIDNFNTETGSYEQMKNRLETILDTLNQFKSIQTQLEESYLTESGDFDEQKSENEREEFENKYHAAVGKANEIIKNRNVLSGLHNAPISIPSSINLGNSLLNSSATYQSNLPPLRLPEFHGSYADWQSFHDSYNTMVHSKSHIPKIEKFHHLSGCLKGEARQVISSISITEANYDTAWDLLKQRYDNRKLLINSHIREILELSSVNRESAKSLRHFLDSFLKNYRTLKTLGEQVETWDSMLIVVLISKLDFAAKREWESYSRDKVQPKINDFTTFLIHRCQILENLSVKPVMINNNSSNHVKKSETKAFYTHNQSNLIKCPLCKENHRIYYCQKFKSLPVNQRYEEVKRLRMCTNCLRANHKFSECQSNDFCKICGKKHATLLHHDPIKTTTSNNIIPPSNDTSLHNKSICSEHNLSQENRNLNSDNSIHNSKNFSSFTSDLNKEPTVLLSTAIVHAKNNQNQPIRCRVLLDNGSQSNFISKSFLKRLNLPTNKINMPVSSINEIKTNITEQTYVTILSLNTNFTVKLSCLIIDKISDATPQNVINISFLDIPNDLCLADPYFNEPSEIDILVGGGIFYELLCKGQIKIGKNLPVLQKSVFGWLVTGKLPLEQEIFKGNSYLRCYFLNSDNGNENSENNKLNHQIEKFWLIEEVPNSKPILSKEEQECENNFVKTTTRDESGRFVVKLPLKNNYTSLGESEQRATNRFLSIERKLSKNGELKQQYQDFMSEYQKLDHMTEIYPENCSSIVPIYYLPHHSVEKPDSLTTKVRVVFDASAKTSTNLSLNNVLKVGPTIQGDLFSIILRFRKHEIALIGDITKMYRMINVHPDHRDLQRIIWRSEPNENLKYYRLNTLTYGTSPASFIATRCLKQIAIENRESYSKESKIIESDFYMDDLLTGSDDSSSLLKLRQNISNILSKYGFELRKFQSNDQYVLKDLYSESHDSKKYLISEDSSIKTLGISWKPKLDCFEYKSQIIIQNNKSFATKRSILSFTAKIFDPLGLLSPLTVRAKVLMQQLFKLKIDWDEKLPQNINYEWSNFLSEVSEVYSVEIPRKVLIKNPIEIELHGFSDSSEKAYGCAIYLRSFNEYGNIQCYLLCAKSRVAPLKQLSLARLELAGSLLLSRLVVKCLDDLQLNINKIFLWTDSTIVLNWLSKEPQTWKTYVANRVAEIQKNTEIEYWRHVPSSQNPADLITRGCKLNDLKKSQIWWQGPSFLFKSIDNWPKLDFKDPHNVSSDILEKRKDKIKNNNSCFVIFLDTDYWLNFIDRYSKLKTIIRVFAYIQKFINNIKSKLQNKKIQTSTLSNLEIQSALFFFIRLVQKTCFESDLARLQNKKPVKNHSKLKSLNPFLDPCDNLIRVGGRLKNSNFKYSQKHPILLPSKPKKSENNSQNLKAYKFTRLIISQEHERALHAGPNATLSHVRQKYWPLHGKQEVKSITQKCIKCFKIKPKDTSYLMGDLPGVRVKPSRPFQNSSIDYTGPFEIKDSKNKNKKFLKAYIVIFICLATRCVHIELVSELTSEGFLSMLKRFVSRRGFCSNLYTDNATCFIGANNEIIKCKRFIENERFQDYLNTAQMSWHFMPARSPHFGGSHESAVKSCKYHLKRVLSNHKLTYEEFYTLLTQIEAVLNSRPLIPLSDNPDDLDVLTPSHFLIGHQLTAVLDEDLTNSKVNCVKRYKHIQQMFQHFWKQWSTSYLHTLQERNKWQFQKSNVMAGSLVMLKENNTPPLHWPLGRIIQLHPGSDGTVRVVTVKTKNGVAQRAVNQICILPIEV